MSKPPETIPVKYSEDLAQYADLRPVVRQPMTLTALVGLVLASTGKQPARVREHLRSGTCTYNIYRYWWDGFELEDNALAAVLAAFPDPDPSRPFRPEACLWVCLRDAQQPKPHTLFIEKEEAGARRWFRGQSFWELLVALAAAKQLVYEDYSYYHRADLYTGELTPAERARLEEESRRLAPRPLARRLRRGHDWMGLEAACARPAAS